MHPRVTAVVVARNGGDHLRRTLQALDDQTHAPDAVVTIDCASTDDTAAILAEPRTEPAIAPHVLVAKEKLSFGGALAAAERTLAPPASEREWLWLLAQDSAPEPRALERLLGAVEVAQSVAVVGPKLMDWDEPDMIREFGQSLTPLGTTVPLVENELDQAQHDSLSDVLAVGAAGMLVRHSLWAELGGFDPALPVVDDALDFCVRTRLAGYRVALVPAARVATAGDGVAGPSRSRKGRVRRKLFRLQRAAQLHRRMVYAPAAAVPAHWLTLVPLAIVRSLVRLLGKQPGAIGGEFAAAFATAFGGMRIGSARHRLARVEKLGWASIAPLRIPFAEVRRARALKREAALVRARGERRDLAFFSGGGSWVVLGALVLGIVVSLPLLGATTLSGGGLLPLSTDVGRLWNDLGYGWRDIGLGFIGAVDPFSAVLAVLGSLTFWQPSFSLVLLFLFALPLAALGAWFAATRLTQRAGLRAVAAVLWVLAPTFLVALADGRPAAVLVHLLLPWLFYAGFAAARSWSASATTSLLFAAVCACAPSLAPALIVIWVGCLVVSRRNIARFIAIPAPAVALFLPLVWDQATRGNVLAIFADPGRVSVAAHASAGQLVLGLPEGALAGWPAFGHDLGLPADLVTVVLPLLLVPLGILVALALFLRGRAILALGIGVLGFATALAASQIWLQSVGSQQTTIWPGSALSLYWAGFVGASVIGLSAIGRISAAPAVASAVLVAVFAAPLALAMPLGTSKVVAGDTRTLPAVAIAEAQSNPRVGTLQITPQPGGGIAVRIIRGAGLTLDTQSTLASTRTELTADQRTVANLAANLSSQSGMDPSKELSAFGIGFVLLSTPASEQGAARSSDQTGLPVAQVRQVASATERRVSTALNSNAALASVGATASGQVWSYQAGSAHAPRQALLSPSAGGTMRVLTLIGQAIVIGIALLLSIPTGRVTEREGRPSRRVRADAAGSAAKPEEPEDVDEAGGADEPADADEPPDQDEPDPGDPDPGDPDDPGEPGGPSDPDDPGEPDERGEPGEPDAPPLAEETGVERGY